MKIVNLSGGLGNQMFQYAFGKAIEAQDEQTLFDISFFDKKKKREQSCAQSSRAKSF